MVADRQPMVNENQLIMYHPCIIGLKLPMSSPQPALFKVPPKVRSGTNLPAAADGSVAPRPLYQPHGCSFQHSGPGSTCTVLRLRPPGLSLRCELSCARVKQAFMNVRGKTMTLCRSSGEPKPAKSKEQRAKSQVQVSKCC